MESVTLKRLHSTHLENYHRVIRDALCSPNTEANGHRVERGGDRAVHYGAEVGITKKEGYSLLCVKRLLQIAKSGGVRLAQRSAQ